MDDFTWKEVGQRLRDWRKTAQLTQRALGASVGLSQPAIQAIESGTCNPQLSSLQLLASALGRTTRELVCDQVLIDDARVQRLQRVLQSRQSLAIIAAEQGLLCAEALLERELVPFSHAHSGTVAIPKTFGKARSGFRREMRTEDTVDLGGLTLRRQQERRTIKSKDTKGNTEMQPSVIQGKRVGFTLKRGPLGMPVAYSDQSTDEAQTASRFSPKKRSEEHLE